MGNKAKDDELYQEMCRVVGKVVLEMRDLGPVSYTHLDVYKRQVQYHGRGGPPGGRPPADPQTIRVKDVTMTALPDKDKLLRNFSRCANWEEKYLYIIELGQRLACLLYTSRCV